jgi:hypothetical protein
LTRELRDGLLDFGRGMRRPGFARPREWLWGVESFSWEAGFFCRGGIQSRLGVLETQRWQRDEAAEDGTG